MDISQYFISGDIKGAINYMCEHEEFKDILNTYITLFEKEEYLNYEIPDVLNDILRFYQIYYHNLFYCDMPLNEADDILLTSLKEYIGFKDANEMELKEKLESLFEANGYHALFGKTQGYYGPYIWKETIPTSYEVELPDITAEYKVNILKGFIFRGWMDYLTFGRFGTGGWAAEDGTICCIEKAYDFKSERFLVYLLKHKTQHTVDMKEFPGITETELEYRAKLVELCYTENPALLSKFITEADNSRENDSHALAAYRIRQNFPDIDLNNVKEIQNHALILFNLSNEEMKEKYQK